MVIHTRMKIFFFAIAAVLGSVHGTTKPNVVFILADDLGYTDVGFHDNSIYSPTIDQLADEGVKLENFYVQPICSPTRAQLLTGRYQIRYGLVHGAVSARKAEGLPVDEVLLPQKLKDLNYKTHMVGKWHLGMSAEDRLPHNRGFDTFYGLLSAGFDHYTHKGTYVNDEYLDLRDNNGPITTESGTYSTTLFTEKALEVIDSQSADTPFFLYLAYAAVHSPFQAPTEYMRMNSGITDQPRKKLAGMVSAMDEGIANITDLLKTKGLWDNTIVVFCGDNGAPSDPSGGRNWPYRGGKESLFEGGMKAAAFVSGGFLRQAARGTVNDELIHISDMFPTIVKGLAGGDIAGLQLDGFNQWSTIARDAASPRTELLHNIDPLEPWHGEIWPGATFDNRIRAALRVGEWKLITGFPGKYNDWREPTDGGTYDVPSVSDPTDKNLWLFNLTADPYEKVDLSEQQPDKVLEMLDRLREYNDEAVDPIQVPVDDLSNPSLHGDVFGPWL